MSDAQENDSPDCRFHFRVRVGVTGHRDLVANKELVDQVRAVLKDIQKLIDPEQTVHLQWEVVSCLADGADRIVAHEVLRNTDASLMAVIPLTRADYENTFGLDARGAPLRLNAVEESRREFDAFLPKDPTSTIYLRGRLIAADAKTPQEQRDLRHAAYREAGEYVLRHCDFLIALYDPHRAGQLGGTRDILDLAHDLGVPTYLIDVSRGDYPIRRYRLRRYDRTGHVAMKTFVTSYNQGSPEHAGSLEWTNPFNPAKAGGLNAASIQEVEQKLVPAYAIASAIAKRNQRSYRLTGILVYVLAMAAIVFVALGAMVASWDIAFFTLEAMALVGILLLVARSHRKGHHSQWILLRFLAERLRAASFLLAVGVSPSPLKQDTALTGFEARCDWTACVFNCIIRKLNTPPPALGTELDAKRAFIANVWVRDQRRWHLKRADERTILDRRFEVIGSTLFYATMLAALAHIFSFILWPSVDYLGRFAVLSALILPSLGAAIIWFRSHREYERLAARSEDMSDQLQAIASTVETASVEEFESIVRRVDNIVLTESQDWRGLVRFLNVKQPA